MVKLDRLPLKIHEVTCRYKHEHLANWITGTHSQSEHPAWQSRLHQNACTNDEWRHPPMERILTNDNLVMQTPCMIDIKSKQLWLSEELIAQTSCRIPKIKANISSHSTSLIEGRNVPKNAVTPFTTQQIAESENVTHHGRQDNKSVLGSNISTMLAHPCLNKKIKQPKILELWIWNEKILTGMPKPKSLLQHMWGTFVTSKQQPQNTTRKGTTRNNEQGQQTFILQVRISIQ